MTVFRQTYLQVLIDGSVDPRAYAARCSFGFDQRYAQATVYRTGGFRYLAGGPADPAIGYWSSVEIKMGCSPGVGLQTRFKGWVVPLENGMWPQEGVLNCKGTLYLAEYVKNENTSTVPWSATPLPGTDLSDYPTGMADEEQIRQILTGCGVPFVSGNIQGTSLALGSWFNNIHAILEVMGDFVPPTPFWWQRGQSGLSYIEQLDLISVPAASNGRYRTFESLDGTVYRLLTVLGQDGTAADFTFTEGVDVLPGARIKRDPTGAGNRVTVTGMSIPQEEGGWGPENFTVTSAFAPYLPSFMPVASPEGYRIVQLPPFGSQMIEKATKAQTKPNGTALNVMSCQQIADLLLFEGNCVLDTVTFSTPRDDLLGPAQQICLMSPRLGLTDPARTNSLQQLSIEYAQDGAFTQSLTCLRRT